MLDTTSFLLRKQAYEHYLNENRLVVMQMISHSLMVVEASRKFVKSI